MWMKHSTQDSPAEVEASSVDVEVNAVDVEATEEDKEVSKSAVDVQPPAAGQKAKPEVVAGVEMKTVILKTNVQLQARLANVAKKLVTFHMSVVQH